MKKTAPWIACAAASKRKFAFHLFAAGALLLAEYSASGALLRSAEITAVVNDVKVVDPVRGERPAGVKDTVRGDLGIKTGQKSRAELLFQDKTLTRLGANTLFSFTQGTRELELEQGTMLLQVPKNVGGAKIRTAAVTAAITGTTIMLEYSPVKWKPRQPRGVSPDVAQMAPEQSLLELQNPKRAYSPPDLAELRRKAALARKATGHVKVMVLEGTLRLYLNNRVGESVLVTAGQMIILSPTALTIPPPVNFDIAMLAKSSLLVNNAFWTGGATDLNMAMVQKQIALQEMEKKKGDLLETNLVIFGTGTQVLAQIEQSANAINTAKTQGQNQSSSSGGGSGSGGSSAGSTTASPLLTLGGGSTPFLGTGGSTATVVLGGTAPAGSTTVSGSAIVTSSLPGTIPVLPTEGPDFVVYSTEGVAENGMNRTATFDTVTYNLPAGVPGDSTAFSVDYRFLTDEINTGANVADRATITISNGTEWIELSIDRDVLQTSPSSPLSPVAQANVGGYNGGSDWLPFTIDVTRFLGGPFTVTFAVWDVGDTVVDSALAIDNVRTGAYPASTAASVPGSLTLNLNSVILGNGSGEFRIPNLEGLPARDNAGPAANSGTFTVNAPDGITLNSLLNASTGANGAGTTFGGQGGTVLFNSTNEAININAPIKVSESDTGTGKASHSGGKIALNSGKTTGVAINISNTGELLALLNAAAPGAGGRIDITSAGGDIAVNGKVIADRGTVDIRNNGPSGQIFLHSAAHVAADVVKVGALGVNGQLTVNAGSQLSAAQTLKLYGGTGSLGKVAFTGAGTVNLSGSQIHIRAKTVEISGATNVNNNGATSVHADNHNYNSAPGVGGGQFRNAVTQGPASGAPGFD